MRKIRASTFSDTKNIERPTIRRVTTDLRSRFLELQVLRQRVRVAQCGTMAPYLDEPPYQVCPRVRGQSEQF